MASKLPSQLFSPSVGSGAPAKVARSAKVRFVCARKRGWPLETFVWGPFFGTRLPLHSLEPTCSPTTRLKGVLSSMNDGTRSDKALLREAFDLLLGLRSQPEARKRLGQAVTFLRMLEHQAESRELPVVVSVQVMRLRSF